jgi:hypothetical protein
LPNIYDTNAKERNSLLTIAKLATTKFAKKPFVHFWIQAGDQLDLERDLNLGFGFPAVIAIAPKKKLIGVLQSTYSVNSISNFLTDLKAGKASMSKLRTKMVFKEAELWDGKDAPTMPDEEGYDDDEEAPPQNSD